MKRICRELQDRLALEGARALREDEAAQRHLEGCEACFQVLEGMSHLDEALSAMVAVDAPEPVVNKLMERVATEPSTDGKAEDEAERATPLRRRPLVRRPMFWSLTSAASVAAVAALLLRSSPERAMRVHPTADERAFLQSLPEPGAVVAEPPAPAPPATLKLAETDGDRLNEYQLRDAETARTDQFESRTFTRRVNPSVGYSYDSTVSSTYIEQPGPEPGGELVQIDADGKRQQAQQAANELAKAVADDQPKDKLEAGRLAAELNKKQDEARTEAYQRAVKAARAKRVDAVVPMETVSGADLSVAEEIEDSVVGGKEREAAAGKVGGVAGGGRTGATPVRVGGVIQEPKVLKRVDPAYPQAAASARVQGTVLLEIVVDAAGKVKSVKVLRGHAMLAPAAVEAVKKWIYAPTVVNGHPVPVVLNVTVTFGPTDSKKPSSSVAPSDDPAARFLRERAATNVAFQEPSGYWRNTYVPGDARMRLLQARLAAWDRSSLAMPPHDSAAPPMQPFDVPRHAALAAYVHADRASLDGPQRMLVQVGLKGSARVGGARPAMNVGVVLDMRGEITTDVAAAMRALAAAFAEARQTGDRFHLIVAGQPGGVVVAPEDFKYGPVAVALERALSGQGSGNTLDMTAAVAAAFQSVCNTNDPDAPFGSSAVVLVTGQALGSATGALADFAHQGAVAGVPLTAVAVGPDAPPTELDALALAGQGRRRVLETRADAPRLVDEELYAASNAVARAVRLRIRLAPGVRLVEVIASQRLDEIQAERVREAERSLDLRLARHMGIESDRGDDEDGIQIVIPSFQTGDAHAVLLDVVAPGPGAIADVSVRYKDVAFLRNGVARASLTLPAGQRAAGPLERNVLKNLLAVRLSSALERAGDAAGAGDMAGAAAQIEGARALLSSLRAQLAGLGGDADLARDVQMLDGYKRLLANAALAPAQRALVADSLRYAGRLKLLRRHV